MPWNIGPKAPHWHYNPMQLKCNACPQWFKSKAGRTRHYRTYHGGPKAMDYPHSKSPIFGGIQLEPKSTTPYTPPLDDRPILDVHDDGFPNQLEESPWLNLSPSPTPSMSSRRGNSSPSDMSYFPSRRPSSQPSSGHADIIPHEKLDSAFFLVLISLDNLCSSISGRPCDEEHNYLPPDTPPSPNPHCNPDDWTPYSDWHEFEMVNFLYHCTQMSMANINALFDLWAASEVLPPFANAADLYDMINSTPLGDIPWQSISFRYEDAPADGRIPDWMTAKYKA
jgi:hypothetical protein